MSIETDLGRIATSLEIIVKHLTTDKAAPAREPAQPAAAKKTAAKPVPTPEPEVDPFAEPQAEISLDTLSDLLKKHAKALGTKTTIALILKHGADKVTPKINTIPTANYAACFAEAEGDLKKVKV